MSASVLTHAHGHGGPPFLEANDGATGKPRLLVVDDHPDIREPMAQFLGARGFAVDTAADGPAMHDHLARARYDLVLLDVMLPGPDGFTLCRELQARRGPPVILLTAMGETRDRVRGLETGADDYVVKPFAPSELLARIRTVLRRVSRQEEAPPPSATARVRFAGWTFDFLQHELVHDEGRRVDLSAGEARLMRAFVTHPQEVLSRERLLDLCAGAEADVFERSIDSHMSRLRRKVETDPRRPRLLKTAWGNGYLFAATVEAAR